MNSYHYVPIEGQDSRISWAPSVIVAAAVVLGAVVGLGFSAASVETTSLHTAPAVRTTPVVRSQASWSAPQGFASPLVEADVAEGSEFIYQPVEKQVLSSPVASWAGLALVSIAAAAGFFFGSRNARQPLLEPFAMVAASGKKEKRGKKAEEEPKAEKVEAAQAPRPKGPKGVKRVFLNMRKAVLRRLKEDPKNYVRKTTGRVCYLLGKKDNRKARSISFSHIRTKRIQRVNLHWRRLWWQEGKCWVLLRLSTKGIKTITKYGLQEAAIKFGLDLTKYVNGTSDRKYTKYLPEKERKVALIRNAQLRYKQAVRWAMLNHEEVPEPPKLPLPSKRKAERAQKAKEAKEAREAAWKANAEEPAVIAMAISHGNKLAKLALPADQRKALIRSLTTELIRHGRIKTTLIRAKAIRKHVDHMISLAKGGSLHQRRQAMGFIYDKDLVKTLFEQVPERYPDREGGYTRIIRTMPRKGDAAKMCYIELV